MSGTGERDPKSRPKAGRTHREPERHLELEFGTVRYTVQYVVFWILTIDKNSSL